MKIDDFIKLLEEKKAKGFEEIISIYNYSQYENDRATEASISEEFLEEIYTDIDEDIKYLVGQKVLVI